MPTATWNGVTLAQSDDTVVVENNHYFPADAVRHEYLHKSGNHYTCVWKGVCDYYTIEANGKTNEDATWVYPNPTPPAKEIAGRYAFWKGVEVTNE